MPKSPVGVAALLVAGLLPSWLPAAPDIVIADFEGKDYGDWKTEGDAFGPGPAQGTLPGQMTVSGYLGRGLVNSFFQGDGTVGTLTSPPFKLERRYVNFLIGGGQYPGEACMVLLVDGQVVRTATGPNDKPGGSERLHWQSWDVGELLGKTAVIRIVDQRTGGWGHINVDQIVESDESQQEVEKTVEIALQKQYLNFPVKNGAEMRRLSVQFTDGTARDFDVELALGEPDFWVFMDVSPFKGQKATVRTNLVEREAGVLARITNDDEIKGAADLYHERYRPQFHFSSRRGWNNDPNGLVYAAGEYHLFYQHNPYGWNWGNMHWGHAVSTDLVHWTELADALHPDPLGPMFSGSAVVDENNTAGFQTGAEKVMVCIYTAAGNPAVQCIAYSNDRGRTWTTYAGNPVLPHIIGGNRDPKVIWYEPGREWIMALYLDQNDYALFSSPDLKQWTRLCDVNVPGTSECPEFFEIPVDGNKQDTRWVFYGGNGQYLIGRFDGKAFTVESGPHRLSFGNCFYASQTFNGIPPADGRRIQIGWGSVNMPGMPFTQMMDFPVELTLRTTNDGLQLFALPVREIETLHGRKHAWKDIVLKEGENPASAVSGELFDVRAEFEVGAAAQFGLYVRGIPVIYDVRSRQLSCPPCSAPVEPEDGKIRLRLLADRTSIEIFANNGRIYMPVGVIPSDQVKSLDVFTRGGPTKMPSLEVYELKSAWQ